MPRHVPTDAERRLFGINPIQRREDNAIRRLRETTAQNVFEEICRRLMRGESATSVATWLYYLRPRGCLQACTYNSIKSYFLEPLRRRLRREMQDRAERIHKTQPPEPQPPPPPSPEDTAAVLTEVEEQTRRVPSHRHHVADLRLLVDEQVAKINGIEMLKYLFFQQDNRLRRFLELEEQGNGMLVPEGTAAIDVMRKIAEAVCKVELGNALLSVRRLHDGINPFGADAATPPPMKPEEGDDLIRRFNALPTVDKNLVRQMGEKVIDMVREDVGARFKTGGLGSEDKASEQQEAGTPATR